MARLTKKYLTQQTMLELAFRAVDTKYGIRVTTNNPEKARTLFYAARAEHRTSGSTELDQIICRIPASDPGAIWLLPSEDIE